MFRERAEPTGKRKKRLHVLPTQPFVDGLSIRDSGAARVRTRKLSLLVWGVGLVSFFAVFAEVVLRWFQPAWSVSYHLMRLEGTEAALAEMNVSYLAGTQLALTCGYVGTALMVLSMAYVLQRRFGWFSRTATAHSAASVSRPDRRRTACRPPARSLRTARRGPPRCARHANG